MTEPRITTEGPVDVEGGYMEFRVNWTAEQLLAMTPEEFARFKASMGALQQLSQPRPPIVVEDEADAFEEAQTLLRQESEAERRRQERAALQEEARRTEGRRAIEPVDDIPF
jgi:hypothetical protein